MSDLCSSLVISKELPSLSAVFFCLTRRECLSLLVKHIPCFSLSGENFQTQTLNVISIPPTPCACRRIITSHSESCSKNFCKLLTGRMGTSVLAAPDFWIALGSVFFFNESFQPLEIWRKIGWGGCAWISHASLRHAIKLGRTPLPGWPCRSLYTKTDLDVTQVKNHNQKGAETIWSYYSVSSKLCIMVPVLSCYCTCVQDSAHIIFNSWKR